MEITAQELLKICRNFKDLKPLEKLVINKVETCGGCFIGSYTKLAVELNKDTTAIRKTVLGLEKRGILSVKKSTVGAYANMLNCKFVPNWDNTWFLNNPWSSN